MTYSDGFLIASTLINLKIRALICWGNFLSYLESGIPGVDDLFHGGFPKGKTILLSGPPGSGKTVFGMQFLIAGALANEPGVLIAFDDLPSHMRADMKSFG